jgi:hypothetical protein
MNCRTIPETLVVAACVVALTCVACSKTEDRAPELATKTAEQPVNQPKTIAGCLHPGAATNTFVLTVAESEGATTTATYELIPKATMDLHAYAGQDVEVSGTLLTRQTVATSGKVEAEPAKGVSGTPTVETKSEVEVRKFEVESVTPKGNRCTEK